MLEIDESLRETEPDCTKGSRSNDITLRAPICKDLERLVALANDPVLSKNLCDSWLPTTPQGAQEWYSAQMEQTDPTLLPFMVEDHMDGLIGVAGLLYDFERKQAEICVIILRSQWNKGYATRIIQAVADFAFSNPTKNKRHFETLTARCRVSCGRSRRIIEKCGFQYCGTGMAHSTHYHGMIPIDRYRLDKGIWKALHDWAQRSNLDTQPKSPQQDRGFLDMKGAA